MPQVGKTELVPDGLGSRPPRARPGTPCDRGARGKLIDHIKRLRLAVISTVSMP